MRAALKERWNAPQGLTLNRVEVDWRAAMQSNETPVRTCSFPGCERIHEALGYCHSHYGQVQRGKPLTPLQAYVRGDLATRLAARTQKSEGCWEWTGGFSDSGYGAIHIDRRLVGVHRVAYELAKGPIPEGMQVDHLCFNRKCVRPEHLDCVTQQVNLARARARKHEQHEPTKEEA